MIRFPRLEGAAGLVYVVREELPIHLGVQVTFISTLRVEINEPPLREVNIALGYEARF